VTAARFFSITFLDLLLRMLVCTLLIKSLGIPNLFWVRDIIMG